jgi:uncharacterized membrane protein YkoI
MADLSDRSTKAIDHNVAALQETNEDLEQRFLTQFHAAQLSLIRAIAIAQELHAGSRAAAITFDVSGTPAYRVRTVRNNEIWDNVIDAATGQAAGQETPWSLKEIEADERDNIIALKSVSQELSDAVAIAEKATAGKAIGGGLAKERDKLNFVVVVLSDDHVKEVYLEPPRTTGRSAAHR